MNWLAYFALLFSAVFAFLHQPWSIYLATAASVCGLFSVLIRDWPSIEKITSPSWPRGSSLSSPQVP
jgi:hypothetical protein